MSLFLKMIYGCLTGAWGGFLSWLLLDPVLGLSSENVYLDALLNGAIIGVCVGALMGVFGGLVEGNLRQSLRGLLAGLLAGLLGGALGLLVGEVLYQALDQEPLIRVAGWAVFGLAIGLGEGVLHGSVRGALLGVAGGLAGGALGSLAFMEVRSSLGQPDFSRALGFTVLGALLGLFVGLMPVLISVISATLKVVTSGRNEGKQILVDKEKTSIGRDDRCDLGLYGDEAVHPHHAEIRRERQGYVLYSTGGAIVQVNGQVANGHPLQHEDRIRVGNQEIVFRHRGT